jgi:hypothetical protein
MPYASKGDNFSFLMIAVYFGERPLGLFDGVVGVGECGVVIVLKMSRVHFFRIHLVVGSCSNIKEELLGLWGLLNFALRSQNFELMVVGDSTVVLDRFVGKSQLNALNLQPWMKKVIELKQNFSWIQYFHVHRKFNSLADSLSKKDLWKHIRWLSCEEVFEDSMTSFGSYFIF